MKKIITRQNFSRKISLSLVAILLTVFTLSCADGGSGTQTARQVENSNHTAPAPRSDVAAAPKDVPIPVLTILDEYQRDAAAADRKYKGAAQFINGAVETTGKTKKGVPFVSFQKQGAASPVGVMVVCSFNPQQAAEIEALKKGQEVKLSGHIQGIIAGNVMIEDCTLRP